MLNEFKNHYLECDCSSAEHVIRYSFDPDAKLNDPTDDYIYTTTFLNQYRSFWKRIWIAIKYIFGYKCKYGHFDCAMINKNEATSLRDFLNEFIEKFSNRVEYEEKLQEYEDEYKDDPDEGVPEVYLLETEIETEMPVNISEIWPDFFSDLCNSNW